MTAAVTRDLAGICQAIRRAPCVHCQEGPGTPCAVSPYGYHMFRTCAAYRRGLITGTEFGVVLHAVGAFTAATILYEPGEQP